METRRIAATIAASASALLAPACDGIIGLKGAIPDAPDVDVADASDAGRTMVDRATDAPTLPDTPSDEEIPDAGNGIAAEQSCAKGGLGLTNCGQSGHESCCASLYVEGGTFFRTYANDGGDATEEADPATVSDFVLDEYEVTVGRFRRFRDAWDAAWRPPPGSGKHVNLHEGHGLSACGSISGYETGWLSTDDTKVTVTDSALSCDLPYATWTSTPGSDENLPINCASWYASYAFCIWDGGFLPSEAEWMYAAAGGSAQREYPWGSTPPGTDNRYAIYDCYYPTGTMSCSLSNIAPVGTPTLGAGAWGQLDLAGNLWEWVFDAYETFLDPAEDCAALATGPEKVFHGGYYDYDFLLPTTRNLAPPTTTGGGLGFRCARSP